MKKKVSDITLENVESFEVPLDTHRLKWKFEDEGEELSEEFKDQIIPLEVKAAQFLWKFESSQRQLGNIPEMPIHYKHTSEFYSGNVSNQAVKKWLYQLGITFDQKVFWIDQPDTAFMLTWKMIIKFSDDLFFGSDAVIWDKTLNWCLNYDHNDKFYFGKDRIDNADIRSEEIKQTNDMMRAIIQASKKK